MPEPKVAQFVSSKIRNFAHCSHGTLMNSKSSKKGEKMVQKKISVLFISLILFSSLLLTARADEGMFLLNKIDQSLMEKMMKSIMPREQAFGTLCSAWVRQLLLSLPKD
jgi:hypothetical protein